MAKPNLFVTILTFLGFLVNLINFPLFNNLLPYWFGLIFNTIGTIASICFFVKAGCIQSIFYREQLESDSHTENGIEVVTTERSDKETTPDAATKKPVDTEDIRVDSLDIIDS